LPDVDVDGDGRLTPLDVLETINRLNGTGTGAFGEGESGRLLAPSIDPLRVDSLSADSFFAEIGSQADPLRARSRRR
jgi:hypothetical protein